MRSIVIFLVLIGMPVVATAAVTVRVCEADGATLFDNRDIMVGTKLTFIGNANNLDPCDCDFLIPEAQLSYGQLSGRDWNDVTMDYKGSRFPAAGQNAVVWDDVAPPDGIGMVFYSDPLPLATGDWFIIDYTALGVGDCNVTFYTKPSTGYPFIPINVYTFHHVPTRDFNADTIVDFADYAILASYWQQGCSGPGWCDGADLDQSGSVNLYDLAMFCDYWLEATQ